MNSQDTADVDIGQLSTPSENERQRPPWPVPTSQYFPTSTVASMLLIFLLSTVFTMTSMHRLNHTDLWGHLSFGRLIIDQQMLPATDPFASGEPAANWHFEAHIEPFISLAAFDRLAVGRHDDCR